MSVKIHGKLRPIVPQNTLESTKILCYNQIPDYEKDQEKEDGTGNAGKAGGDNLQ